MRLFKKLLGLQRNTKLRYKFVKAKAYFEKGYALTHYIKYLIAFFGLASQNLIMTMIAGLLYIPFCFCLGWFWLNHGWYTLEIEVGNEFNRFVKEMRNAIKK